MQRSSDPIRLPITQIFLLSAIFAVLGGCDSNPNQVLKNDRPRRVAWVTDQPDNLRWEAIQRAVAFKAPNYPFLRIIPPGSGVNPADGSQIPTVAEQLAQAVEAEAQFVVLWLNSKSPPLEAITAAEQSGITIVTLGRTIPRELASNHVNVHLPAAAEQLGRDLPQLAAGRQAFILIHHRNRDPDAKTRYERFHAGLTTQAQMVLVGEADATERDPVATLQQQIELFPSTTLVVTLESDLWLSPAARSIRADIRYITLDAPPVLWRDLQTGRALALIGPLDGEIGSRALSLVADLATTAKRPLPNRSVDCQFVSKSKLTEFATAYAESVNVPLKKLLPE